MVTSCNLAFTYRNRHTLTSWPDAFPKCIDCVPLPPCQGGMFRTSPYWPSFPRGIGALSGCVKGAELVHVVEERFKYIVALEVKHCGSRFCRSWPVVRAVMTLVLNSPYSYLWNLVCLSRLLDEYEFASPGKLLIVHLLSTRRRY